MSDRAALLGQALVEERYEDIWGTVAEETTDHLHRFLADRFPGITIEEINRGILIACEVIQNDPGSLKP